MALIHITGDPRAGKTSLAVAMTITEDLTYSNWRYASACKYIKSKNKTSQLQRALPPQRHVVFSNILMARYYPCMSSYPMSGFEFGAPNPYYKTTRPLVPYGVYVFDEAQRYFDSKGEGPLPPWVTQAFELHGHIFLKIMLITQRPVRLHKDIRSICSDRIHIEKSIHIYKVGRRKIKSTKFLDVGRLIHTVWYGRQFQSAGEHERYVDSERDEDKKLGKPFKYEFKGDIKSHYNPYAYAVEMEDLSKDFNYIDYGPTERPAEWSNYKKQKESEKKTEKGVKEDNG